MKITTTVLHGFMTCKKRDDGEKATVTFTPDERIYYREDKNVISVSSKITDETYEQFKPFGFEACKDGRSLSGVSQFKNSDENSDEKSNYYNFVAKITMVTPKKTYICDCNRSKLTTVDGIKALKMEFSTSDVLGTGATAKKALSFSDLSKTERNVTLIVNSNTPSFDELLGLKLKTFSTFSTAIIAADFENDPAVQGLFYGQTSYTMLTPINKAFDKLSSETVENLLKPENKSKLRDLLRNHVFTGKLSVADIKKKKYLTAVSGKRFNVHVKEDGSVIVGGATIITPDAKTVNGWAHVTDSVLQ